MGGLFKSLSQQQTLRFLQKWNWNKSYALEYFEKRIFLSGVFKIRGVKSLINEKIGLAATMFLKFLGGWNNSPGEIEFAG